MGIVRWVLKGLLSALFLALAILSVVIGGQRSESVSLGVPPISSQRLERTLLDAFNDSDVETFDRVFRALSVYAPLNEVPFEIQMIKSGAQGRIQDADRAAAAAIKRSPRSLAVGFHHLQHAATEGDLANSLYQYRRLSRLRAMEPGALSEAIIGVFRENGEWHVLIEELRSNPDGGAILFWKLMQEPVMIEGLESLLSLYPEYQRPYFERLVQEGNLRLAYTSWIRFAGLQGEKRLKSPFNGSFQIRSEAPPFNWRISNQYAEMLSSGGMYVTYSGVGAPLIAEQIISVGQGLYVLETTLQGDLPVDGARLHWKLQCIESSYVITDTPISLIRIGVSEVSETEITVPSGGCEFQRIALWGRPGTDPKPAWAEFLSVELRKQ